MFTVEGKLRHGALPTWATWDEGRIDAPEGTFRRILNEASVMEGTELGPPEGPTTRTRHLATGLGAVFLLRQVFAEDAVFTGDVPRRPSIPDGAIG